MKKNNKLLSLFLVVTFALGMSACGGASPDSASGELGALENTVSSTTVSETGEMAQLTVFAAASMKETLTKIAELYKESAPNIVISFNFDSSGTLKTQIEEGAACDLFISASPKQMDQLDSSKVGEENPDRLDFVEQGTRVDLLENRVVLAVPEGNPTGINSFDDLARALKGGDVLLAMGNGDVPVGQYTQKIFAYYSLSEDEMAKSGVLTYGSNVKEVTTQVSEGSVDGGVVYCTDATSAGLMVVDSATSKMCGQVIYPAAVLNVSENKDVAQEFLDYLKTDEAMSVFESVGFSRAK